MLVLSRRARQKIVFPAFQTTVEVLQVRGNVAKLGITAPDHVKVAREEILPAGAVSLAAGCAATANAQPALPASESSLRELRHLARNQLHSWSLGLALLRGQWEKGMFDELESTLERLDGELASARERQAAIEERQHKAVAGAACKALLVEDDQNERELLAGFLRMSGYDVATAGDGADALDYLASQDRPDVLLLDMMMPRCDGPTTVRRIRENPRWQGLKIFAVSGASRNEVQLDEGPMALDGWFSKPIDPRTLLRKLSRELAPQGV